jgi:hypothetical protein
MREGPRPRQAWADYVAMGPGRSLESLLERYRNVASAPTNRLNTLKEWSVAFHWQDRLGAIADQEAAAAEERDAAERRETMESGYALGWQRVRTLKSLAEKLTEELLKDGTDNRLWLPDAKMLGVGQFAERFDLERFNSAEVAELRGIFSDLRTEVDTAALEARVAAIEQALEAQGKGVRR